MRTDTGTYMINHQGRELDLHFGSHACILTPSREGGQNDTYPRALPHCQSDQIIEDDKNESR